LLYAVADNRLERHEQDRLVDLVGKEYADRAIGFVREHGPEAVHGKFDEAVGKVAHHPLTIRLGIHAAVKAAVQPGEQEGLRMLGVLENRLGLSSGLDKGKST